MSGVDLHIHTSASDGKLSPAEIVRKSVELGLTVIAITDHDTVNGIAPALTEALAFPQLRVIPGIELSTDVPHGEVHVLGYFIDYTDQKLLTRLEKMRSSREERAQKMIAKLKKLGINIEWQRVQEIAGSGSIGRPHIAEAILEKGYIASFKEAFTRYIGREGPAYVEREKMTPVEAVELVLLAKGLPVLAHPPTVSEPDALVARLKAAGLVGIEAYYNGYPADTMKPLIDLAEQNGLIITGGSDYHGIDDTIETMIGGANVPPEAAEQLISLAEQRATGLSILSEQYGR